MPKHIAEKISGGFSHNFYVETDIKSIIPEECGYHCHGGLELLYVHQGRGTIIIDCTPYRYCDHSIILFQPYQIHGIFPDYDSPYIRSVLVLDPDFTNTPYDFFPKSTNFLARISKGLLTCQVIDDSKLLLDSYIRFLSTNQLLSRSTLEEDALAALQIIHLISRYEDSFYKTSSISQTDHQAYISQILHYIEHHYQENYSINHLASHLNISKYYLAHMFKQHTGITIGDYYLQYRIRQAKLLLSSTNLPVATISDMVGFSTPSYFSAKFKELEHFSPGEYRIRI